MTPKLKTMLASDGIVVAPGAYDALSAKVATTEGADAVYMTGFGVSGSILGMPDVGLLSATEMADRARAMASATSPVPLIADADNGHGGVLNVARMVQLYEQAGVQCIQLEDQVMPKRCGHMNSKEVIDRQEAKAKITAAVDARSSDDFLIMARTDARGVLGFKEALRRGEDFAEAGADILFIEAPQNREELETVCKTFSGIHLVANMVEDGKTPYLSANELQEIGFSLAIYPVSSLLVVAKTLQETYRGLLSKGRLPTDAQRISFAQYNDLVGLSDLLPEAAGK